MKENLRAAFEGLKEGVRGLQLDAARGDVQAVADGLAECLVAIEQLEEAVLHVTPPEE